MTMTGDQRIVIDAARCCCAARQRGERCVMPRIYRTLDRYGCGILTPVVLGLVQACEACLHRRLMIGCGALSDDECGLLTLLDNPDAGPDAFRSNGVSAEMSQLLTCAAVCAKIMIREACGRRVEWDSRVPLRVLAHG